MNNIDLGSAFDGDIAAASDHIKLLIQSNASFDEVEQAQIRLRELLAAKRSYLYTPKDPAYFIDQMFSAATPEERRKRAGELEGQVIKLLIRLSKEDSASQERELPAYDLLIDVLAFLRFFKGRGGDDTPPPGDVLENLASAENPLHWGGKPGLSIRRFCDALATAKYITMENARLLEAILEDYKPTIGKQPSINWDGSLESLATFLFMCHNLGILNPAKAKTRSRVVFSDYFNEAESYDVPPIADIITRCFSFNGWIPKNSTVSRTYYPKIIAAFEAIRDSIDPYFDANKLSDDEHNFKWDYTLHVFFELLDKQRISQNEVLEGLQVVDVEVLRFLNDLLIECGPNRREAAIRLARLP